MSPTIRNPISNGGTSTLNNDSFTIVGGKIVDVELVSAN